MSSQLEEAFERAEQLPGFVNIFFIRYLAPNTGWAVQITASEEVTGGFRNRSEWGQGATKIDALNDAVRQRTATT